MYLHDKLLVFTFYYFFYSKTKRNRSFPTWTSGHAETAAAFAGHGTGRRIGTGPAQFVRLFTNLSGTGVAGAAETSRTSFERRGDRLLP